MTGKSQLARERRVEGIFPERPVLGTVLATIGIIVLAGFLLTDFDRYQLVAVSAVCLIAFGFTREYGFAVPAGIIGGLGLGVLLATVVAAPDVSAAFMVSVAGGFAAIWLIGLFASPTERHPWPLIPTAVIGTVGASLITRNPAVLDWLQIGIAIALVMAGILAVVRRRSANDSSGA